MAIARDSSSSVAVLAIALLFMTLVGQSFGQLKQGFYIGKCKNNNVEKVIEGIVTAAFQKDKSIAAALLRMHFHDCFGGCDASLLLNGPEKKAGPNGSVRGYELIDACKLSLEQKCPGVVSCADIIAVATKVAVTLVKGRSYNVETGRRDSTFSRASDAAGLPGPTTAISDAVELFRRRNLSVNDMVLLIGGGHTVGKIHCFFFLDRIYNFQNSGGPDTSMNPTTLSSLKKICPRSGSNNVASADQFPGSADTFDKGFYQAIRQGQGLLLIDQRMASDPLTRDIVRTLAVTGDFAFTFGSAMIKLGRVGVLTGKQGQIRKTCSRVN